MTGVELGADHRPPGRLAILGGAVVRCPLTDTPQPVSRCHPCRHLQGTLDGPEPAVLCSAAAARTDRGLRRRVHDLVFLQDWPEAD